MSQPVRAKHVALALLGTVRAPRASVWLLIGLASLGGCSRAYYRQAADTQVYDILTQKARDPRWTIPRFDVVPDPRSRLFDPTNPDCPPLPPDDPTAQRYMKSVYGMRGSKRWGCMDTVDFLENPDWPLFFNGSRDAAAGSLPAIDDLSLADAVELSLIHGRDYQTRLENLYLAALSLTYQRYLFDVRPTGFLGEPGTGLFYEHQPDDESNLRLGTTNLGISRLLPTGAQFVAELANNTLWMFSGPNSAASATTIAYSLVQPLLRGACREIALEDLTQAERNVVYALRNFARFRKEFFVSTITGGQVAGLQRFLRGFEFLAGPGEATSVGFFPVLLRLQQQRNREMIVRTIEFLIEEMRAEGAGPLDIARLESAQAYYRSDLLAETRTLQDRMDQYKIQLGLPPVMDVKLDDSLLEPFQFVDPALIEVENGLRILGRDLRNLPTPAGPGRLEELKTHLLQLGDQVASAIGLVESDFRRLDVVLPDRLSELDGDGRRQLEELMSEERAHFDNLRGRFNQTVGQLQSLDQQIAGQPVPPDQQEHVLESIRALQSGLLVTIRRASIVQIIVRVELISVQPVDLDMTRAVQLALANRLDLMNRRASVMDARRRLEVAADAMESNLDLVVEGEVNTPPLDANGNPAAFRARDSQFRVGLGFTTPLDRRAERNNFRAAQIAYQQARRGYVAAEDNVAMEVRQSVRTLQEMEQSIIQRRRRMQYSARELDLAETQADVTQRGLSLTSALRSLNHAQDDLIETWLDYETTRLNLYRDIGTMQIDHRGFWTDPFYQQMIDDNDEKPGAAQFPEEVPRPSAQPD
ncbi:MAG: TolC family protein [Planctomycetota bacterium]|jgi:hypothetical protein